MNVWVYAIGSIVFISLLSLGGVFTLALNPGRLKQILLYLVSFAVGGLYGDAFIHLIPEAFRKFGIGMTPCLYIRGDIHFLPGRKNNTMESGQHFRKYQSRAPACPHDAYNRRHS